MRLTITYALLRSCLCIVAIVTLGLLFDYAATTVSSNIQAEGFWDALETASLSLYPRNLLVLFVGALLLTRATVWYQDEDEKEKTIKAPSC